MQGEVWPGRQECGGRSRCKQRAGEGLDCRLGAGHGEGRTLNMAYMVLTLDVLKLSGWSNADAP